MLHHTLSFVAKPNVFLTVRTLCFLLYIFAFLVDTYCCYSLQNYLEFHIKRNNEIDIHPLSSLLSTSLFSSLPTKNKLSASPNDYVCVMRIL